MPANVTPLDWIGQLINSEMVFVFFVLSASHHALLAQYCCWSSAVVIFDLCVTLEVLSYLLGSVIGHNTASVWPKALPHPSRSRVCLPRLPLLPPGLSMTHPGRRRPHLLAPVQCVWAGFVFVFQLVFPWLIAVFSRVLVYQFKWSQ